MQELIEYVAKSLVDQPERVRVRKIDGDRSVIFELQVAPQDMGKIIGKQGRIANSIRALLKVAATREGKHAVLEII